MNDMTSEIIDNFMKWSNTESINVWIVFRQSFLI